MVEIRKRTLIALLMAIAILLVTTLVSTTLLVAHKGSLLGDKDLDNNVGMKSTMDEESSVVPDHSPTLTILRTKPPKVFQRIDRLAEFEVLRAKERAQARERKAQFEELMEEFRHLKSGWIPDCDPDGKASLMEIRYSTFMSNGYPPCSWYDEARELLDKLKNTTVCNAA